MLAVNIILNLILLPIYGAVAAAWATLISFMVGAILSWALGRYLFILPSLMKDFCGSIFATFTMLIILNLLPSMPTILWLSIKVLIAIITYGLLAWILDIAGFRRFIKV
jgi:peptidoglycan biosynthesis protein MviN/MurJ (putative lipid II flippase)